MRILYGMLLMLVLLVGAGLILMYGGVYDVAATSRDNVVVRWALDTTKDQSIRARAGNDSPAIPADSATFGRGFQAYEEMCVVCHGAPGIERGWMGKGMQPEPPDLSEEAEEFTTAELSWILSNGIKLAGMPALAPTHSEEAIQELVAFVARLPELSADEYARLRAAQAPVQVDTTAGDGHTGHTH